VEDVVEWLGASKQSYVESEHEPGLEVRAEWATGGVQYGALLLIAKAVEEARREIDMQTLQDLVGPEHKLDADDWARFWENRGFSGASEPSNARDRAFADGAARSFQKVRSQL